MTWAEKAHVDARSEFGTTGKLSDNALTGRQAINKYVSALFSRYGAHQGRPTAISRFSPFLSTWAR